MQKQCLTVSLGTAGKVPIISSSGRYWSVYQKLSLALVGGGAVSGCREQSLRTAAEVPPTSPLGRCLLECVSEAVSLWGVGEQSLAVSSSLSGQLVRCL
ncbi:hypothetical protein FKM82_029831 [Ascaphus truei]